MEENKKSLGDEKGLFFHGGEGELLASFAALFIAIVFHFLLFAALPYEIKISLPEEDTQLQVEVSPPELEVARRTPEFIEANPLGNRQTPDTDSPESFQDQRAADEIPDPDSRSRRPYVEGELIEGNKIVSGTGTDFPSSPHEVSEIMERPLAPNTPAHMQNFPVPDSGAKSGGASQKKSDEGKSEESGDSSDEIRSAPEESAPEVLQNAKAGDELSPKKEGKESLQDNLQDSENDFDSQQNDKGEGKEIGDEKFEQALKKDAKEQQQELPQIDESLPSPRPRPQISMRTPPGPLADNRSRASNQGTVSADSKFSEFGAYQQRMIEAISRQWNLLGMKSNLTGAINSHVVIEFTLNNRGELTKIEILFSNSTNTGRELCKMSILSTAPYGEWTQEMVNSLGLQDQSVQITFHYR